LEEISEVTTLLMFSGGLDSTGALYTLLREGARVHVHHAHLHNIENRVVQEAQAVQKVLRILERTYHFTYSESSHKYPMMNGVFPMDADILSLVAGELCIANKDFTAVAIGMIADDLQQPGDQERINRAQRIWGAFEHTAQKVYPVQHLTKQEVWDMLPSDIREATWSCRTPRGGVPCGVCRTCQKLATLVKDREHWDTLKPPLAPNAMEVAIYAEYCTNRKVCLLGLTKELRQLADITVDLAPSADVHMDWLEIGNIGATFDTVIGDGVLNLVDQSLKGEALKVASTFVCRVFTKKLNGMKYATHFPTDFSDATRVVHTQDGVAIVVYEKGRHRSERPTLCALTGILFLHHEGFTWVRAMENLRQEDLA
jgi:7-cyano-7-deazaguanine synthase in queuosine biosynthesis